MQTILEIAEFVGLWLALAVVVALVLGKWIARNAGDEPSDPHEDLLGDRPDVPKPLRRRPF